MPILEIRSYRLLPGTRDEYHRLFLEEAWPILQARGIDVVAFGPSIDDPNGYFLMRSYADLAERERLEEAFYASPEWREGPREAVVSRIDVYTDVVVEVDDATIEGLRRSLSR
jgi:hypothetical protein